MFVEPLILKLGYEGCKISVPGCQQNQPLASSFEKFLFQPVVIGCHQHGALGGSHKVHFYLAASYQHKYVHCQTMTYHLPASEECLIFYRQGQANDLTISK